MAIIDYDRARELLAQIFAEAEAAHSANVQDAIDASLSEAADAIFASDTQSYREVLLGCGLARLIDRSIDIRRPYRNQGERAFSGRSLDERVINPFLRERRIPSSKGPYLAVFRRSIELVPETAVGLKDKAGYEAMMRYLDALERADDETARALVRYLLRRFLALREKSTIPLARISRLSLDQHDKLIKFLMQTPSGGLIPVLLVVAMLRTIRECFALSWQIEFQGINVADQASGAGGDVTVKENGRTILAIEITERVIDKSRVVSTFDTKIIESGIEDYLFIYSQSPPSEDALATAAAYFAQGHEINFLPVREWIVNNLSTIGARCRSIFTRETIALLETPETPAKIKVAWNDAVRHAVSR